MLDNVKKCEATFDNVKTFVTAYSALHSTTLIPIH